MKLKQHSGSDAASISNHILRSIYKYVRTLKNIEMVFKYTNNSVEKNPFFFLFVFVFFFPRYFRRFYFSFFFRLQPLRVFGCLVFSGRDRSIGGSTRYVVSCVCACVPRTHYLVHTTGTYSSTGRTPLPLAVRCQLPPIRSR